MRARNSCRTCGHDNPGGAGFCTSCGAELHASTSDTYLSVGRVTLFSILSGGIYAFWWFYITWKQLRPETGDEHYPIWHALTLSVPIYSLFRMHRHVSVINELAAGAGAVVSISPGLAVALLGVGGALGFSSFGIDEPLILVLFALITTALTTTLIALAQRTLNLYWQSAKGADLRAAPLGKGEVVFVLIGLAIWAVALVPA